jgi:tetratricopeptide (TPR) repeat protein
VIRAGAVAAACAALACCASQPPEPESAASYRDYLIGRIADLRADHSVASDRYFSALSRSPDNAALINGAVVSSLAAGDPERARRAARLGARGQDALAFAELVLATDALAARDGRTALRHLNRVEGAAVEELVARMLLVWVNAGEGATGLADNDLRAFASIQPYGGLFAYQRAMALDYSGRKEEALAAYEIGADSGLWLPTVVERHADLLVRMGRRDSAASLLGAEGARSNAGVAAALARFETGQAIAEAPLTPARGAAVGLYGLAAIFMQEQDSSNGLATLSLALMLDPGFDAARLSFAQMQSELGQAETALETLAGIDAQSPYAVSARTVEAWIALDAGDEERALALARANGETGDPRALRGLADLYRTLKRHADAEPIYDRLIAQEPDNWRLYFARGAARERQGRWSDAEADFKRALEISPDQPEVLNYLGYGWVDRGERLQEGLALIQRAVALRPNSGAIVDSLGWAYFRLGDYPRALELLERAVELEPADATLNDHLGDVYWRVGRRIEARYQWQRALTFGPDDPAPIQAKLVNGLPDLSPARTARR